LKYTSVGFGSAPEEIRYDPCPNNPLHGILSGESESFRSHLNDCPNRVNKITTLDLPSPAIDMSLSGQLNYKHGLISMKDITIEATPAPKSSQTTRPNVINLHLNDRAFTVYREDRNSGIEENDIWIHQFTFANPREWIGLKLIEDSRSHSQYLVGLIFPDKSNQMSENRFQGLSKILTVSNSNKNAIAVCFQAASEKNRIIFLAHRSEETGFGRVVGNTAEIGVFYLQHSMLYNNVSLVNSLQNTIQNEKQEKNELKNAFIASEQEKVKIISEFNAMKIEFDMILAKEREQKAAYESRVLDHSKEIANIRSQVYHQIELIRREAQSEAQELSMKLEKVTNEKNTLQMNFYAEVQTMKKNDKNNQDIINNLMNELKDANKKNRELDDVSNSLQVRLLDQRRRISGNEADFIEEVVRQEREKVHAEYSDKELCTICVTEKKNVVFMPCGHFNYCSICVKALGIEIGKKIPPTHIHSSCPVCHDIIDKALRAFPY
jgi:rubrerythrin